MTATISHCMHKECGSPVFSRGLCRRHHCTHYRAGTLIDFPTQWRPRPHVVEDWLELRHLGRRLAAERLGMTYDAFVRALQRGVKDGLLTFEQSQSPPA